MAASVDFQPADDELVVGVVADTHVPDRAPSLHPALIPALRAAGVRRILHAGDICTRRVLAELAAVAPVTAVRGNRDIFAGPLPLMVELELGGARVALMHSHGGWIPYLWDKWRYLTSGYNLRRHLKHLDRVSTPVRVVVFGHSHYPELRWRKGRLLFNPGSASMGSPDDPPSFGLLRIRAGQVRGEIIPLTGWQLVNYRWVQPPGEDEAESQAGGGS